MWHAHFRSHQVGPEGALECVRKVDGYLGELVRRPRRRGAPGRAVLPDRHRGPRPLRYRRRRPNGGDARRAFARVHRCADLRPTRPSAWPRPSSPTTSPGYSLHLSSTTRIEIHAGRVSRRAARSPSPGVVARRVKAVKAELVEHAPLAPEPELLTTLAAFLRMDLAPSLAAQKLNIHLDRARGPQPAGVRGE